MKFSWEEVFSLIVTSFKPTFPEDSDALLGVWIKLVADKMSVTDYSIRKILEMEMEEHEIFELFCNTGYKLCNGCRNIVEDDHICDI